MPPPICGRQLFCKDLYDDKKRCFFIPKKVEELLVLQLKDGALVTPLESIEVSKRICLGLERKCSFEVFIPKRQCLSFR